MLHIPNCHFSKLKTVFGTKTAGDSILFSSPYRYTWIRNHRTHVRTHNLAVVVLPAAVGGGQCGRALLQVPRLASALGRAGDGDGVDGVGVAVAGAVVPAAPAVAGSPHEDGAAALSPLSEERRRNDGGATVDSV